MDQNSLYSVHDEDGTRFIPVLRKELDGISLFVIGDRRGYEYEVMITV